MNNENNMSTLNKFFDLSKRSPWGRLIAVQTPLSFLKPYTEGEIANILKRVISNSGWERENSFNWANKGSGNEVFFIFKVYELWKSIQQNGVKSPVHIHYVPSDDEFRFHPSNNKIEVLCEYFEEQTVTVLYHDYDLFKLHYHTDLVFWYEQFPYTIIDNADDYLSLFNLTDAHEVELGYDFCKKICEHPEDVWGKVKPRARDWRYVDIQQLQGTPELENALFLTVTDRYHRVAMQEDAIELSDIINVDGNIITYCGKEYDLS
jgi:hypothetical protein